MELQGDYPLNIWCRTHPELKGTKKWRQAEILRAAWNAATSSARIGHTWWLSYDDASAPEPDILGCIALYGYARQIIQELDEFPIDVPDDQVELWRKWGLGTSLREFHSTAVAGAAGGFMKPATKRPEYTFNLIQAQLNSHRERLAELTSKPLEWFEPGEYTEEERDEGEDGEDRVRLTEVFRIFEDLLCFVYALPKFKSMVLLQESERFGVPNKELFEYLNQIDLGQLLLRVGQAEPRIREIRQYIDYKPYTLIDSPTAPKLFWWRHWKEHQASPSSRRSR